ncbi:hypothetical protein [Mycolicibacterium holsaticum]|jgi:hypothetical protein|uniref:DUF4386 domain-containing protein n=1 Tax=Mycolicibacterium holsaticum TaxID=152142 RepID=A0A1E3S0G0_9MYCO|nr:hypothetical protein [Mycolicibacterium holsaticum]MDA4109684.1 membrane protein [Mycolicibacterium holsaticum DSM 44478 = JCM 12374]ODQ95599.1 hypothetical protein BHQ17_04245 [Mycolicibacterium holsaticum]QZA10616.1 hypothetical protein K3U96_15075 [Mycolicibacterium holsaticum DSM 44478 = JCM 12374]UNC11880.1 hypothetical protein H5U41_11755 [Mycolicibacterium holsaticum DSM 44478 = JCM 12374]
MGSGTIRLGGLCGIASAVVIVPAYLAGSPETPDDPNRVQAYFDSAASFLTANGTLPLLHILFGVLFLGVLTATLRSAAGPTGAVFTAIIGGTVFLALMAAGLSAEVAVPAAIVQFDDMTVTEFSQPFLGLALWLYHYAQLGAATLIFATAYVIWRSGVLPKWSAALGVLGVPALLHTWIGLPGAYSTAAWLALTGLVMLALPPVVRVESVGV